MKRSQETPTEAVFEVMLQPVIVVVDAESIKTPPPSPLRTRSQDI